MKWSLSKAYPKLYSLVASELPPDTPDVVILTALITAWNNLSQEEQDYYLNEARGS